MTSWRSPYSTTLPYPITESRPPRLIRQIFSQSKICRKGEYFHFAGQTVTSWLELSRRHDDVTLLWGSRHCRLSSPPKIGDAKPIHVKGKPKRLSISFFRPIINLRRQVTNWILPKRYGGRSWQAFSECKDCLLFFVRCVFANSRKQTFRRTLFAQLLSPCKNVQTINQSINSIYQS